MIAIHHTKATFSDRWVAYCKEKNIPFKIVDCYKNDIIHQLKGCDALMWHFHHAHSKDTLFAKQLMYSAAAMGKITFPDLNSIWHFDDKVGQKYLLEAVAAPLAPSHVFYSKKDALEWINHTHFPKVFKLRSGSSSAGVKLVKTKGEAETLINKAFGKGFKKFDGWENFIERLRKFRNGKTTITDVCKGFIRIFYKTKYARMAGREKGYIYFQDFIANNNSDIRVVVINQKAFAIKRLARENDFRASGSGSILYDKELFDVETVKIAFEVSEKLNAKCLAYDFVYNSNKPLIVEISYGFATAGYDPCPGYWDRELNWYEGPFNPQSWMVEDVLQQTKSKKG